MSRCPECYETRQHWHSKVACPRCGDAPMVVVDEMSPHIQRPGTERTLCGRLAEPVNVGGPDEELSESTCRACVKSEPKPTNPSTDTSTGDSHE